MVGLHEGIASHPYTAAYFQASGERKLFTVYPACQEADFGFYPVFSGIYSLRIKGGSGQAPEAPVDGLTNTPGYGCRRVDLRVKKRLIYWGFSILKAWLF
jgi:hypothetical protein